MDYGRYRPVCVLCGGQVDLFDGPLSWKSQFRLIYRVGVDVACSGLVVYETSDTGPPVAPINYESHWTLPGRENRYLDLPEDQGRVTFVTNETFPIHDACLSLLRHAFHPRSLPLKRIYDVFRSFPGCLSESKNFRHYPKDGYEHPYNEIWANSRPAYEDVVEPDPTAESAFKIVLQSNPVDAPEVSELLSEPAQATSHPTSLRNSPTAPELSGDIFFTLPPELRCAIAIHLHTVNVLRCRLASRAFWVVFDDQSFWASRFRANAERSWLYEVHEFRGAIDWRDLYHRTKYEHVGLRLRHRVRIWDLAQLAKNFVNLQRPELSQPSSAVTDYAGSLIRYCIVGRLWRRPLENDQHQFIQRGNLVLYQRAFSILERTVQATVFFVHLEDATYISGLKLLGEAGQCIQLGYNGNVTRVMRLNGLLGFNIALGDDGIEAIQFITHSWLPLPWLGNHEGVPQTSRLVEPSQITKITAGFDACKLTKIGVGGSNTDRPRELRTTAMWYPSIPEPILNLHEHAFFDRSLHIETCKPLCWTHFGGCGGIYLRHLVQIRAYYYSGITRIQFLYNADSPTPVQNLGKRYVANHPPPGKFDVDGPGGEFINGVDLYHLSSDVDTTWMLVKRPRQLWAIKLYTNKGREQFFDQGAYGRTLPSLDKVHSIRLEPGMGITGFYTEDELSNCTYGFPSLGVISETIAE